MNRMPNPVDNMDSAIKKYTPYERSLSSLRAGTTSEHALVTRTSMKSTRSGMDMMPNPVNMKSSAIKKSNQFSSFRSGCCSTVSVWYSTSKIIGYDFLYGYYYEEPGYINGAYYYRMGSNGPNGDICIWRINENNGQWIVGECSRLGSGYGFFVNNEYTDCPHYPAYTWYFHSGNNNFHPAYEGMSIWCED